MKLLKSLLFTALMVLLFMPIMTMAAEPGSAVVTDTGSTGWNMALTIVLPIVLAVSSAFANFFTIKPTDPPVLIFVKRIVNLLALNISKKAGQ